jgi:hypothetical protein
MDIKVFEETINERINDDLEFFQRLVDEGVYIDERSTILEDKLDYVKLFLINAKNQQNHFYLGISTKLEKIESIKLELGKIQKVLSQSLE